MDGKRYYHSPPVTVCAWCKAFKNADGEWMKDHRERKNITHGICPKCLEHMKTTPQYETK